MSKRIPLEVVKDQDESFYVSERKVYPRDVSGRFDRMRKLAVFWLLGMYYLFPWLSWDGRQAVLFDLPARKFYVFGLIFWPQDFSLLALLLIVLALTLFFVTALAGRLWCGYACPQTVWTECFLWMERWTEGDRIKRMKLDAGPWNREKVLRKGSKHLLWLFFALWTGFTFVGFFTPIVSLGQRLWPFDWNGAETFWVLFYALATWANAGILREQVCKYMCPYARFQSAMFDNDTLIIAYDPMRGEPRGPRKRGLPSVLQRARGLLDLASAYDYVFRASKHPSAAQARLQAAGTVMLGDAGSEAAPLPKFEPEELGDCIDCTMCVQVCPVGIDIRNGLQYECIACGACIDACDEVMDKVGMPHGLIRYTTQHALDGGRTRVLRPRIFIYGLLLLGLVGTWVWNVTHRDTLIVDVLRDRNALYRQTGDGLVENDYTLKLVNKNTQPRRYRLSLGADDAGLRLNGPATIEAGPEQVLPVVVSVTATEEVQGRRVLHFVVESEDGREKRVIENSFFGPVQ
ncbi:4Fe-4S dicluster domain-containing protein [Stenotrophomonas sp. NLF4-10]|uniref:4Fe-4S dicluster domain-containing protein n=1 Tax=Stenotrophomonas sp. NLF4-10 TaxID=2918754 RepID=UPI001EFBB32A|nr:4Fe-4S dicluster domain-containing protein [Stenotrophomonas sp. NLF4-10]MCG8277065.1 4Fe-4S binding protein [Stenotrophomonas sp. NLF4-10]